jgi:hypothetical protein
MGYKLKMKEEDVLFINFMQYNKEEYLRDLVKLLSPWLFEVVYHLLPDELAAVQILKESWEDFIINKNEFYPLQGSIKYEIFKIVKEKSLSYDKDIPKIRQVSGYERRRIVSGLQG